MSDRSFLEFWSLNFDDIAFIEGLNLVSRVWTAFRIRFFRTHGRFPPCADNPWPAILRHPGVRRASDRDRSAVRARLVEDQVAELQESGPLLARRIPASPSHQQAWSRVSFLARSGKTCTLGSTLSHGVCGQCRRRGCQTARAGVFARGATGTLSEIGQYGVPAGNMRPAGSRAWPEGGGP